MYKVIIAPKAQKQLREIAKELHKSALANAIEDLKDNPYLGKKLGRNLSHLYSYRIGVYRIIYKIKEKESEIEVVVAGYKANIYQ